MSTYTVDELIKSVKERMQQIIEAQTPATQRDMREYEALQEELVLYEARKARIPKYTPGPYVLKIMDVNADGSPRRGAVQSVEVSNNFAMWLSENDKKRSEGDWGTVTMATFHPSLNGSGSGNGPEYMLTTEEAFANAELILRLLNEHHERTKGET